MSDSAGSPPPVEELDEAQFHVYALHTVGNVLGLTRDLDALLASAIDMFLEITRADAGFIMLMDDKTDALVFGAAKGFKKGVVEKIRADVEKDIAREIAHKRPPILLADLKGSRLGSFFQELFQPLSEVEISRCFPLARSGKLVGLINTSKGQTGQIIRESAHRLVFGTICDRVAVAVENAQLFRHVEQQLKELQKHREHLEELVEERTAELRKMVNLMADREIRMAELKETIKKLRDQIEEAGMTPVADDSLREGGSQESDA